jgi:hypothetical protein
MILESACVFIVLLMWATFSVAKVYVTLGLRRRSARMADEVIRGAQLSLGTSASALPKSVLAAAVNLKRGFHDQIIPHDSLLWELGNSIGEACRQSGYQEGLKVSAKPDDQIRIDMSVNELLHMSWLAHLGFQHMMPNYRGVEVHRFGGATDAREAARSVAILECALPKNDRPFVDTRTQMLTREKMISDWWVAKAELHSV